MNDNDPFELYILAKDIAFTTGLRYAVPNSNNVDNRSHRP